MTPKYTLQQPAKNQQFRKPPAAKPETTITTNEPEYTLQQPANNWQPTKQHPLLQQPAKNRQNQQPTN